MTGHPHDAPCDFRLPLGPNIAPKDLQINSTFMLTSIITGYGRIKPMEKSSERKGPMRRNISICLQGRTIGHRGSAVGYRAKAFAYFSHNCRQRRAFSFAHCAYLSGTTL